MSKIGEILSTEGGRCVEIESHLGQGGQADVYLVRNITDGQKGVVKLFNEKFHNSLTEKRIRYLIHCDIERWCPIFVPPIDIIKTDSLLGHYARYVVGKRLDEFLATTDINLLEALTLSLALVHAVEVLGQHDMAHGDLQEGNLVIDFVNRVPSLRIIDLDNFAAPGYTEVPCYGHEYYLPPEISQKWEASRNSSTAEKVDANPDVKSDLFSLAVLLHEILLFKHPTAGADTTTEQFNRVMRSGKWLHHPLNNSVENNPGGYPPGVLDAAIIRLLERGLGTNRERRPTPQEWKAALAKATRKVYICEECTGPNILDLTKSCCILCDEPYPVFKLVAENGVTIDLNAGCLRIGRDDLRASQAVSSRHAVFRKFGPEIWMEPIGSNPTYIYNSNWQKLPNGKYRMLKNGNRLKFADFEVKIVEEKPPRPKAPKVVAPAPSLIDSYTVPTKVDPLVVAPTFTISSTVSTGYSSGVSTSHMSGVTATFHTSKLPSWKTNVKAVVKDMLSL